MAGQYIIRLGKGTIISFSTIRVQTPLGYITFYIRDINKLGVKLNNLKNILIQGDNWVPVIRKWGYS